MNRTVFFVAYLLLFECVVHAQVKSRCSSYQKTMQYENLQPLLVRFLEDESPFKTNIAFHRNDDTLIIPIHFIIVHKPGVPIGQGNNYSYDKIISQLHVINQDFNRMNADSINTPQVFSKGSAKIKFCLPKFDENGDATNGITRYESELNFDDNELQIKSDTRWPREKYLNIWVASIEDLGFAYIPGTNSLPNETLDGVVIDHSTFGGPNTGALPPYDRGRTATHEIGHYLGLKHIWGSNGCSGDDGITDTPLQDRSSSGCPIHPRPSCNNTGDMFMNYMDYTEDLCMNAFSKNQCSHMRSVLLSLRSSITVTAKQICGLTNLKLSVVEVQNPKCNGDSNGMITVKGIDGIGPYQYKLGNTFNSSGVFDKLKSGFYNIKVIDSKNDSVEVDVMLKQPPKITTTKSLTNNKCFGDSNGLIELSSHGGNQGPFMYKINDEEFNTNLKYENLPNGNYKIIVKDSAGCFDSFMVQITSPEMLTANEEVKQIACINEKGQILLRPIGGIAPYIFYLNQTKKDNGYHENLDTGAYIYQIIDQNDCQVSDTINITSANSNLQSSYEIIPVLCNADSSGKITVFTNGGFEPIVFAIDNTEFQSSNFFARLKADFYIIKSKDEKNCIVQDTVIIKEPLPISLDKTAIASQNGKYELYLKANGGTIPYEYKVDESEWQTDSVFLDIDQGLHHVSVKDSNDCLLIEEYLINNTEEFFDEAGFQILPNPLSDNFAIKYNGSKLDEVIIEFYDISNKLFYSSEQIKFSPEKNIHNIFANNIANSIFIVKIVSKFKSYHILAIKE